MKKMLVALCAIMSVASVSAYFIEVDNKTDKRIDVKYQTKKIMTVPRISKRRTNVSAKYSSLFIQPFGGQRQTFNIPQNKRGKNIKINVAQGRNRLNVSLAAQ